MFDQARTRRVPQRIAVIPRDRGEQDAMLSGFRRAAPSHAHIAPLRGGLDWV